MDRHKFKVIVGILVLALLLYFNPNKQAHLEALEPCIDAAMEDASQKGNWIEKIGFFFGGDAIKQSIRDALYVKSFGICSVGYINQEKVSFGILGIVFVND